VNITLILTDNNNNKCRTEKEHRIKEKVVIYRDLYLFKRSSKTVDDVRAEKLLIMTM